MSLLTVSKKPKAPAVSRHPLSLFEPLGPFDSFVGKMNRRWGQMFSGFPHLPVLGSDRAAWAPSVDLYEEDEEMVLKADLPGLKREDIELSIENGDIVIRGERSDEREIKDIDFSKHLLQRIPKRILASLPRGFTWSDWGRVERIAESLDQIGRKPLFDPHRFVHDPAA